MRADVHRPPLPLVEDDVFDQLAQVKGLTTRNRRGVFEQLDGFEDPLGRVDTKFRLRRFIVRDILRRRELDETNWRGQFVQKHPSDPAHRIRPQLTAKFLGNVRHFRAKRPRPRLRFGRLDGDVQGLLDVFVGLLPALLPQLGQILGASLCAQTPRRFQARVP